MCHKLHGRAVVAIMPTLGVWSVLPSEVSLLLALPRPVAPTECVSRYSRPLAIKLTVANLGGTAIPSVNALAERIFFKGCLSHRGGCWGLHPLKHPPHVWSHSSLALYPGQQPSGKGPQRAKYGVGMEAPIRFELSNALNNSPQVPSGPQSTTKLYKKRPLKQLSDWSSAVVSA